MIVTDFLLIADRSNDPLQGGLDMFSMARMNIVDHLKTTFQMIVVEGDVAYEYKMECKTVELSVRPISSEEYDSLKLLKEDVKKYVPDPVAEGT